MKPEELKKILHEHAVWLKNPDRGKRADLCGANLCEVDLYEADLRMAKLRRVNFRNASLRNVNLCGAGLHGANLCGTDLRGANLDFSSGIPFYCGGTRIRGDSRLFAQLVYHLTRQDWSACTKEEKDWLKSIPQEIVNSFCEYRKDIDKI